MVRPGRVARHVSSGRVANGLILGIVLVPLAACNRSADNQSSLPAMVSAAPLRNEVTLSPGQAKVVSIEIAGVRQFPVFRDVPGSIGYADDPALSQAESTLLGAAATYNLTQKELQRVNKLGGENGIAAKEMEQAVSDAQTADSALRAARDGVRILGKSDIQIDHMIATGRMDAPSAHPTEKWATVNVVESDTPLFRKGLPVKLSVDAFPGRWFTGAVAEVYSSVDPNSHRVTLRARIEDPRDDLRSGMLADVVVETGAPIAAIGIPDTGVVRQGDGTMTAWTTSDRRHFVQHVVTTGLHSDGNVQIIKGLNAGDQVVGNGAIFLDNMLQAVPSD